MAMTVTDNSPSAGYIAWSGVSISYKGSVYSITDGSTNYAYIYWLYSNPTIFYGTNTFPTLGGDDLLVFINKSGVHATVPNTTVIDGSMIVPESILANQIAANAITSSELAANAVTAGKVAANAITAGTIAANAIGAGAIAAGVITGDRMVAGTITATQIAANTITAAQIAADTITANQIAANAITASELAANAVTAGKIAANAITAGTVAANAIGAGAIAAGVITADRMVAGTITAASGIIANLAVGSAQIADAAITSAKIGSLAVGTGAIADAAITTAKIGNLAVTAAQIADGTITNAKIANATIDKAKIASVDAGSITTGTLTAITISGVTITGANITSVISGKSDNVSLNGGSLLATAYNVAIGDGFYDSSGGRVVTTIDPTTFKRTTTPETASPTYNVGYTFEVTSNRLNIAASRNNYGYSSGIQIDVSTTIPSIKSHPNPGPNVKGWWQIMDLNMITWRPSTGTGSTLTAKDGVLSTDGNLEILGGSIEVRNRGGGYAFIDFSNDTIADYDMRLILVNDDQLLVDGGNLKVGDVSYKDGTSIKDNSGAYTWNWPDGNFYNLETAGSMGQIFRNGSVRLVFEVGGATARIESAGGGAANLVVSTVNGSSDRELKKNITDYDKSALHEINTTPIRNYNFKEEIDGIDPLHVGIIMQEAPIDVVDIRGNGVDLYAMIAMSWKAIQELSAEVETLKDRLVALESTQTPAA